MANSSTFCGLISSSSTIHTNIPSLQHFSPDISTITTRVPSFAQDFDHVAFSDLIKRVDGNIEVSNGDKVVQSPDSLSSDPPISSKFAGVVSSPILLREKWNVGFIKDDHLAAIHMEDSSMVKETAAQLKEEGNKADLVSESPCMVAASVKGKGILTDMENASSMEYMAAMNKEANFQKSDPFPNKNNDHMYFGSIKVNTNSNFNPKSPFSSSTRTSLRYIELENINGNVFVRPTWEMAMHEKKRWENTAVGYFLGKKLSFLAIKNFVMLVWKGLKEVKATSNGFYFFKFESEELMIDVIEGGPWMYAGQPLFLQRWKEGMSVEKQNHKEVPIWVKFRNIPTEYWTADGLSTVASAVGRPLYPDAFTSSMERIDYARVCVVVDIKSNFRDHVFMLLPSMDGEYNGSCKISIEYEWRPKLCSSCNSFGHVESDCPLVKKVIQRPKPVQIYVPKAKSDEDWKDAKRSRKKTEEVKRREATTSYTTKATTRPKDNKDVIVSNSFAILDDLEAEELLSEVDATVVSMRGPNAAPLESVR